MRSTDEESHNSWKCCLRSTSGKGLRELFFCSALIMKLSRSSYQCGMIPFLACFRVAGLQLPQWFVVAEWVCIRAHRTVEIIDRHLVNRGALKVWVDGEAVMSWYLGIEKAIIFKTIHFRLLDLEETSIWYEVSFRMLYLHIISKSSRKECFLELQFKTVRFSQIIPQALLTSMDATYPTTSPGSPLHLLHITLPHIPVISF